MTRKALLDNATLTGIERLLGRIRVKNTYNLDGDILCLENLIFSMLFYDELFFIDDYKPEFRDGRASFFNFIKPLEIKEGQIELIEKRSREILDKLPHTVKNGKLQSDELRQLLDLIQMNLIFTWDMQSSEFYLTLKLLADEAKVGEIEKYGALSAMITSGFTEQNRVSIEPASQELKILDKNGQPIKGGIGAEVKLKNDKSKLSNGINGNTTRFLSGLSWLCFRTIFYEQIAETNHCELILHPIRHSCLVSILPHINLDDPSRYRPIMDAMRGAANQSLINIGDSTSTTTIKYPMIFFSAWLSNKGIKPSNFLQEVQNIRTEQTFEKARKKFAELEAKHTIHGEGRFKTEANLLVKELFFLLSQLNTKYGITTAQGMPLSPLIWAYNFYGTAHGAPPIPKLDAQIPLSKPLNDTIINAWPRNGLTAVFKSVIEDLAQVSRFGSLHDKIISDVQYVKEPFPSSITTMNPKYLGARSNWSAPMD